MTADALHLTPHPDADLDRLHRQLTTRAAETNLVDVAYRTIDSPVGPLLLAVTQAGVVRVAFAVEDHDRILNDLAARISPRVLEAANQTDSLARQLDEYFAGTRRQFELDLDLQLVDGFRRTVISRLSDIPYGATASYGQVAALTQSPKASRAVGSACATNPIPLVVPCHRVVRADGSIGQYLAGVSTKAQLLELEAAA